MANVPKKDGDNHPDTGFSFSQATSQAAEGSQESNTVQQEQVSDGSLPQNLLIAMSDSGKFLFLLSS